MTTASSYLRGQSDAFARAVSAFARRIPLSDERRPRLEAADQPCAKLQGLDGPPMGPMGPRWARWAPSVVNMAPPPVGRSMSI